MKLQTPDRNISRTIAKTTKVFLAILIYIKRITLRMKMKVIFVRMPL